MNSIHTFLSNMAFVSTTSISISFHTTFLPSNPCSKTNLPTLHFLPNLQKRPCYRPQPIIITMSKDDSKSNDNGVPSETSRINSNFDLPFKPKLGKDVGDRYLQMLRNLTEQESALSNPLGLKMSHQIIKFDDDGLGPLDRYVYVEERDCIGCTHCATTAPQTFMLEDDHGRARVFDQTGNDIDTVEEAIDTCPVNCIYYVSWDDLITLELLRREQVINNFARLVGGQDLTASKKLDKTTTVMDSGIMRCEDCPGRGCATCPLYGVGENPEYVRKKAIRDKKKRENNSIQSKKRNRKLM